MPVSPQDFALWSDLTGNPYPSTPAERMALAPEVYQFTRGIGRRGGIQMSPLRKAVDVIGKTALAAGAIAGAAYLGAEGYKRLNLDDEPGVPSSPEPVANPAAVQPADITPPTTADRYGQDIVPHQTSTMQELRGVSPAKPTVVSSEQKPATQSEVITSSQTFTPGTEIEQLTTKEAPYSPVRDRADELIAEFLGGVSAEQRAQKRIDQSVAEYAAGIAGRGERVLKDVLKEGREEGISPIGMKSVQAAQSFRQTPEYATMMRGAGASMEPEELVGAPGAEVVISGVRPVSTTRVVGVEPVEVDSPIAEMAAPTKVTVVKEPVAVAVKSEPSVIETAAPETIELAKKAFGHLPLEQAVSLLTKKGSSGEITTSQPSTLRVSESQAPTGKEFLERKIAGGLPQATPRGSAQQALAEFSELYEGQTNPERVAASTQPSSSFIEYARVYPGDLMGVKLKNASIEYGHKVDPEFTPYLTEMIKRGEFYGKDYNELKALGLIKSPALGHEKGEF